MVLKSSSSTPGLRITARGCERLQTSGRKRQRLFRPSAALTGLAAVLRRTTDLRLQPWVACRATFLSACAVRMHRRLLARESAAQARDAPCCNARFWSARFWCWSAPSTNGETKCGRRSTS
eukprot:scaffold756_cov75-Phaeocystis_antarctica.AAC.1